MDAHTRSPLNTRKWCHAYYPHELGRKQAVTPNSLVCAKTDTKIIPSLAQGSTPTRPPRHLWSPHPSGRAGIPASRGSSPTDDGRLPQGTRGSKAAAWSGPRDTEPVPAPRPQKIRVSFARTLSGRGSFYAEGRRLRVTAAHEPTLHEAQVPRLSRLQ